MKIKLIAIDVDHQIHATLCETDEPLHVPLAGDHVVYEYKECRIVHRVFRYAANQTVVELHVTKHLEV